MLKYISIHYCFLLIWRPKMFASVCLRFQAHSTRHDPHFKGDQSRKVTIIYWRFFVFNFVLTTADCLWTDQCPKTAQLCTASFISYNMLQNCNCLRSWTASLIFICCLLKSILYRSFRTAPFPLNQTLHSVLCSKFSISGHLSVPCFPNDCVSVPSHCIIFIFSLH